MSIYDFTVKDQNEQDVALSAYKDLVLLIVNTATECGFTPQYKGLQSLYDKYADRGFEILDFPCNQFAGQAPGTDEEIATFCTGRFGITFPQFHKINVNGSDEAPLYTFLKSKNEGAGGGRIKWNFTKFLVDRDGKVVARFSPAKKPEDLETEIEKLL